MLSNGDVTKRIQVLFEHPIEELTPYIKYNLRQIIFREAVIGLCGGPAMEQNGTTKTPQSDYCKVCKTVNKNIDCSKCDTSTIKRSDDIWLEKKKK